MAGTGDRGAGPVPRDLPSALLQHLARASAHPASPLLAPLVESLRERFGDALQAVLLYGSTLHNDDPTDGLVDLYAVVDAYGRAYPGGFLRLCNRLLPPNVFYLQRDTPEGVTVRCKYAVVSMEHLRRGTSRWFHPYLWARFAQPVRLLYARGLDAEGRIHDALARAVLTFLRETAASLGPGAVTSSEIWKEGLERTYASELRPERDRARHLVERHADEYRVRTAAAAPALPSFLEPAGDDLYRPLGGAALRRRQARRWALRRWQGKLLSVLRLAKAVFTFENGADYIAWKVERHTGVPIEVTPRLRRHPILFSPPVLWRLLRARAIR